MSAKHSKCDFDYRPVLKTFLYFYVMKLDKPEYNIHEEDVKWVMLLSDKEKQKAYKIWVKRRERLFDAYCNAASDFDMQLMDWIGRLEVEMYERCCAIKYPQCVKQIFIYENPQLQAGRWGVIAKNLPESFKKKYFVSNKI